MTQQGNRPPVRRLDAAGLAAPSLRQTERRPSQPEQGLRARPLEQYVEQGEDESQSEYDAGPVQPIGEQPAAPVRVPRMAQTHGPDLEQCAVVFTRPYDAYGEPISRVTFRRPVTRDIRKIGNPLVLKTHPDGTVTVEEINLERVAQYVEVLSDPPLPPSTINQFDYFDLDACSAVIGRFFVKLA